MSMSEYECFDVRCGGSGGEPRLPPDHLEPLRCGDDDCLKLIRPGDKYHVENGTVYCDECFKSESA